MWKYRYLNEKDVTEIYWQDEKVGSFEGQITEWIGMLPGADAKDVILNAVENPMTASLLYGFEEIREDEE